MKVLCFLLVLISASSWGAKPKVLFAINRGFYADEYFVPLAQFQEAGFQVTTVAIERHPIAPDARHVGQFPSVLPELTFKDVNPENYDAVVFAGGNGSWTDYFPNEDVHKVLTAFYKQGKLTALLCSSTGLLGVANNFSGDQKPLAEGKKVTGYYRVEGLLKHLGKVQYFPGVKGEPMVVKDGNLITGRDPLSAELFGKTIVEELLNK